MHKLLVDAATSIAGKLGYAISPTWRLDDMPLANHLRKVLQHFSIDTVFDVGANSGQYRDFMRERVGFDGVIHSFEPVSSLADQIAARAASDPSWQLHRYALGSAETRLEINVAASDRFSSFLESGVTPDSRFAGSLAVERREQVAVKRLDDVWRGLCASVPEKIYLKVDTQGFDLEVMRGSPGLLREIHALQFELSIQPLYKGTLNYLEMLRQLNDWGFELSGLFPITSDNNLRAVELDCVMIARDR